MASADPAPEPTESAAPAAPQGPIPFADDPRVERCFSEVVQATLRGTAKLEVFGLVCERQPAPDEASLYGYPVVARGDVAGAARDAFLASLYESVASDAAIAMCFEPHHGLRATYDGHTAEAVVCFACSQVNVYLDGQDVGGGAISDASRESFERVLGPDRPRDSKHVAGVPLHEWVDTFAKLDAQRALTEDEGRAVAAIADALTWAGPWFLRDASKALAGLGPRAAPALPGLRRALRDERPSVVQGAVAVIRALGPAGGPAAADLASAYERDYTPWLEPEDPEELEDDPDGAYRVEDEYLEDLGFSILHALAELGPLAEPARPLATRLLEHEDPVVVDAAKVLLEALDGE